MKNIEDYATSMQEFAAELTPVTVETQIRGRSPKKLSRKVGRAQRLNPRFPVLFNSALSVLVEMSENGASQKEVDAQKHKVIKMLNTMKKEPNNAHTVKALVAGKHMSDDQEKMIQQSAQKASHGKIKPYNPNGVRQHVSSRHQGKVVDMSKVTMTVINNLTHTVNEIKAMPVLEIVEVIQQTA